MEDEVLTGAADRKQRFAGTKFVCRPLARRVRCKTPSLTYDLQTVKVFQWEVGAVIIVKDLATRQFVGSAVHIPPYLQAIESGTAECLRAASHDKIRSLGIHSPS